MKQLSASKKRKLLSALKKYRKKYLVGKYAESELNEAATRLMINSFLTDVLGFIGIEEIKTECMIRDTFADYLIQMDGKRYFIVEVKAMSSELLDKHLRQAVNYATNDKEGIEWVLLTNGKNFDFYKILFTKPIERRKVFGLDLSDKARLKTAVECLQYMTKRLLSKRGLDYLWTKCSALDPANFSRLFYSKSIVNNLRRQIKKIYKCKFNKDDILPAITRVIEDKVENVQPRRERKARRKRKIAKATNELFSPATIALQN